jgi:hypothetical protein
MIKIDPKKVIKVEPKKIKQGIILELETIIVIVSIIMILLLLNQKHTLNFALTIPNTSIRIYDYTQSEAAIIQIQI